MAKHSNLYLTDENVMPTYILFLDQTQFAELLKVVIGDTRTAEVQCTLDLSDANWLAILEDIPINFPRFAT